VLWLIRPPWDTQTCKVVCLTCPVTEVGNFEVKLTDLARIWPLDSKKLNQKQRFSLQNRTKNLTEVIVCKPHTPAALCVWCADKVYQADSGGTGDDMDCDGDVAEFEFHTKPHDKADVVVAFATVQGTRLTVLCLMIPINLENVREFFLSGNSPEVREMCANF